MLVGGGGTEVGVWVGWLVGKIEDVGWLCPPTEIQRRRSLIKGETGRWG